MSEQWSDKHAWIVLECMIASARVVMGMHEKDTPEDNAAQTRMAWIIRDAELLKSRYVQAFDDEVRHE